MRIINILGTEYKLFVEPSSANKKLEKCNGYTDYSVKEIHVNDFEEDSKDMMAQKDLEVFKNKVIRHEIIHAFLLESGLDSNSGGVDNWATNEEMVDWIAIQFSKIHKVFVDLEIL